MSNEYAYGVTKLKNSKQGAFAHHSIVFEVGRSVVQSSSRPMI